MTEFESFLLSEYLVRVQLVGKEKSRLKESAIISKSLLIEEWWRKDGSQRLLWILKLPVIIRRFQMLISVSFRYFKTEWDESEQTFIS